MATAQVKQHDYHLVDPSPWPIVGSVSAFIMAVGAIAWMHHMFSPAVPPIIFFIGVAGVLYTMASWWADVIREAQYKGDHTRVVQISHRYGMILFIASEVMFFVAWFWIFFEMALFHHVRTLSPIDSTVVPSLPIHNGPRENKSTPSCRRSTCSADVKRPGPRARSRSRISARALRIRSIPASGSSARNRTPEPTPRPSLDTLSIYEVP